MLRNKNHRHGWICELTDGETDETKHAVSHCTYGLTKADIPFLESTALIRAYLNSGNMVFTIYAYVNNITHRDITNAAGETH